MPGTIEMHQVKVTLTIAGDIELFDQVAFRTLLASAFTGVSEQDITLNCSVSSIRVDVTMLLHNATVAENVG